MPDGLEMFPAYLRQAGYYTTNSKKRDYNCIESDDVWNEPSAEKDAWRNRPTKETPFFHVITFEETHESRLHFKLDKVGSNTDANSADMKIWPIHPDTELFRYTYACLQDRVMDVDKQTSEIIEMLKKDELLEDTFIIYFGDNGGTLPGSKGYLYDTGLHIPLIVRIPEKFRNLIPKTNYHRISGFVSFVDFGATMLNLAGVRIPKGIDGRPFLGKNILFEELNKRDEAYGYADRFDELYFTSRTLNKGNMKYIRNYEPFYPNSLQNNYRYEMAAFQQWRELYKEEKLNTVQSNFFEPKGSEELYDLAVDPFETHNLVSDSKYKSKLKELRYRLKKHTKDMPDLGIIPECVWLQEGGTETPVEYGQKNKKRIALYIETADLMLDPFERVENKLKSDLTDKDKLIRFWALTVCASFGNKAKGLKEIAKVLTEDKDNLVSCRAALFLTIIGELDPEPIFKRILGLAKNEAESLFILNDLVFLRDSGFGCNFNFSRHDVAKTGLQVNRRLEYLGW